MKHAIAAVYSHRPELHRLPGTFDSRDEALAAIAARPRTPQGGGPAMENVRVVFLSLDSGARQMAVASLSPANEVSPWEPMIASFHGVSTDDYSRQLQAAYRCEAQYVVAPLEEMVCAMKAGSLGVPNLQGDFYHGTARSKHAFSEGRVAYFAPDFESAASHALCDAEVEEEDAVPVVLRARLSLRNPARLDCLQMQDLHINSREVDWLRGLGYDGALYKMDDEKVPAEIVVFDAASVHVQEVIEVTRQNIPAAMAQRHRMSLPPVVDQYLAVSQGQEESRNLMP